ncbi:dna-directed dna polymerase epsilon 2 [Nannochloropsis oceanica]
MSSSTTAAANRAIFRAFKLRGLSVKADAVAALVSVLTHEEDVDGALDAILDAIKGLIERGELKSSLVDRSIIETVVKQLTKDENDLNQEAVAIWDAFSMPKMTYEPQTKSFAFTFDKRRKMNPDAGARARMFRERYQLARQRVMRNELFVKPIMGHDRNYLKLATSTVYPPSSSTMLPPSVLKPPSSSSPDLTIQAPVPSSLAGLSLQIVLFREDIMKKMLRHSILQGCKDHDGHAEEPLVRCLVQSLLDQGHLCPLPLKARPIAWEYDNALRLYPLPDLLILGDHSMNTSIEYAGCQVVSPGCFPVDDSFAAYYPATRTVEASMLPH